MRRGKIVGEVPAKDASQELIMKFIMTEEEARKQ
jgi:hypothetical protein